MNPFSIPKLSSIIFKSGAKQFVVQLEALTTVSLPVSLSSFTPLTIVSISSLPGADINTFFAPAFKCKPAFSVEVNAPVHSKTRSTPKSFQGNNAGSFSLNIFINLTLDITMLSSL